MNQNIKQLAEDNEYIRLNITKSVRINSCGIKVTKNPAFQN